MEQFDKKVDTELEPNWVQCGIIIQFFIGLNIILPKQMTTHKYQMIMLVKERKFHGKYLFSL